MLIQSVFLCFQLLLQNIGYSFVNLYLNFFAPNVYMCYRPQLEPETSEPSISEFDSPQLHPTHYSNIHHQRRMYDDGTQNIEEASVSWCSLIFWLVAGLVSIIKDWSSVLIPPFTDKTLSVWLFCSYKYTWSLCRLIYTSKLDIAFLSNPLVFTLVRASGFSWLGHNFCMHLRIFKSLIINVYHNERMCRIQNSGPFLNGQGHT